MMTDEGRGAKYELGVRGLFAFIVLFGLPAVLMACPACKEALFDPSQLHQKLSAAKGYALSIALLLSVPSALVGGIALLIVRASRSARRSSTPPHQLTR